MKSSWKVANGGQKQSRDLVRFRDRCFHQFVTPTLANMVVGYLFSGDPLTMHIKHRQKRRVYLVYETILVLLVCLALYVFATRMVTASEHFACQDSSVFQLSKLIISNGRKMIINIHRKCCCVSTS